jgi:hypothetical protein
VPCIACSDDLRIMNSYKSRRARSSNSYSTARQSQSLWPGEYAVRDFEGNDPVRKEKITRKSTIHGGSPIP